MAPVTHFDIDDQWNAENIAEAQRIKEENANFLKTHRLGVWDAFANMDCDLEDEAIEVKR